MKHQGAYFFATQCSLGENYTVINVQKLHFASFA